MHGEAVGAFGLEPFLHLVGDGLGRADHGEAGIAAEPLRELAHGEVLPPRQRRSRARGRSCWRCSRESRAAVRPDRTSRRRGRARSTARRWRWRSARGCRAWRACRAPPRRVSPTTTKQPGRIFMWSRIAADLLRAALHVGVERLPDGEARLRGEHRLGGLGGELAAGLGGAGLHDHRPALRPAARC